MYDEGRYLVEIVSQAVGCNKNGNAEVQIVVRPKGIYQEDGAFEPRQAQWERTIYITLTERTIGTVEQPGWATETLRYLGWDSDSFEDLDPSSDGFVDLKGREVDAVCQHALWEGKPREKWSVLRPNSGKPSLASLERKELRALNALFGKARPKAAPNRRPSKPQPADTFADEGASSDTPF